MLPCHFSISQDSVCMRFQREHGFERAYLSLGINYDLRSLFSWNTQQV